MARRRDHSLPACPLVGATGSNAALVQGAIDGLHSEGLNSVGIYASPGVWSGIVGNYQPPVPYWAADWGINPATTCQNVKSLYSGAARRPGADGPVQLAEHRLCPTAA